MHCEIFARFYKEFFENPGSLRYNNLETENDYPLKEFKESSVKVSTGPAQNKKGARKRPCKQTILQGQRI